MREKTSILLIYTGGTIGMIKDFKTGVLKAFNFDKLLERIPELSHLDCEVKTYSFANPIDSSNMNPAYWQDITHVIAKNYTLYDGFVVLHGSDTMSYTASALSFMLQHLQKPVILTGSQLPIGDLRTDAKENLITSIQLAALKQNGAPLIQEVGLYFEYKLYRGNRTTKINAEHFQAFSSLNYPPLAESGVHLKVDKEYLLPYTSAPLKVYDRLEPSVLIVKIFPGITPQILKAMLSSSLIKAVVLETYGAGNAPTASWFYTILEDLQRRKIVVVNVTQCSGGSVMMGHYETSSRLTSLGVVSGKDITSEAAITKLMHLLGQEIPYETVKKIFERPICGEIS